MKLYMKQNWQIYLNKEVTTMKSKFDLALEIVKNPNYNKDLNFGQLQKLPKEQLIDLYFEVKYRKDVKNG